MKTLVGLLLLSASISASAITPLSDQERKEYDNEVNAYKIMPQEACRVSEDGFDLFLEYFTRNPKLAAQFTAPSATQPFYLSLRDYDWVYALPNNDFENPSAVLTTNFEKTSPPTVRLTVQKAEYEGDYNLVRQWGEVKTYRFVFAGGCWKRVQ